jgi:hypothetical protein
MTTAMRRAEEIEGHNLSWKRKVPKVKGFDLVSIYPRISRASEAEEGQVKPFPV